METNEFGEKEYKPLPQNIDPKDAVKKYEQEANPRLKPYGKQIVDKGFYNLLKAFVIILAVALGIFLLMAYNGNFKTDIDIPACPNISIPECPTCPQNNCDLSCPQVNLSCGDSKIYVVNGS